jgi:outer membrane protein OmpA-like peptidoglycan-associated protein
LQKEPFLAENRGGTVARVLFLLMLLSAGSLHAQVAAEMDALLETPAINFVQASRFVLAAADIFQPEGYQADGHPAAFDLARDRGWLPKKAIATSQVRLGELCLLVMRAFNMKGSVLYALFPGPRYAFRELDYLRMIPGRRDPARRVSGEELLRIVDLVMAGETTDWAAESGVVPPEPRQIPPEPVAAAVPELPPALPTSAAVVAEEREQIALVIRAVLEEREVADTSVRVEEEGIVISLNNIQFMPDSTELTAGERAKLREIAAILALYPGRNILVGGHTAMAGTGEGRIRISTERARSVADFLLALGVREAEEIIVTGYGAVRPLGDTATEEGRAVNRRVEIILLDRGQP